MLGTGTCIFWWIDVLCWMDRKNFDSHLVAWRAWNRPSPLSFLPCVPGSQQHGDHPYWFHVPCTNKNTQQPRRNAVTVHNTLEHVKKSWKKTWLATGHAHYQCDVWIPFFRLRWWQRSEWNFQCMMRNLHQNTPQVATGIGIVSERRRIDHFPECK